VDLSASFILTRLSELLLDGYHRPNQGGASCTPERSLGCGSPDHH
jgi:hypothetical protein